MTYLGISKIKGICAICKNNYPKGSQVYHNPLKSKGNHIAHRECWETLIRERGIQVSTGPKSEVVSSEKLDPTF